MRCAEKKFARGLFVAACFVLCVAATAHAQGHGSGGMGGSGGGGMGGPQFPSGGGMGGPGGVGGPSAPRFPGTDRGRAGAPDSGRDNNGRENGPRGQSTPRSNQPDGRTGLQLGPPGQRWWDDHSFVKNLKLRPEQQARMDAIFEQNRSALVSRFESVQQAEGQMAELANSPAPDEAALFTQIDRVAQARAELEKANTHMLLELRKEMDADQVKRLESKR